MLFRCVALHIPPGNPCSVTGPPADDNCVVVQLNYRYQSKHRLMFNWFMKLSHLVDWDVHETEEPLKRKSNEVKEISGKRRMQFMRKV